MPNSQPAHLSNAAHGDLVAGITNGVLSIPQGMAFALIAGLPPECGLYAMIVPTIAAALLRSSPFIITGATNTSALVLGATLASLSPALLHAHGPVAVMVAATLLMGLIQTLCGLLRWGDIGRFISQAVLLGFIHGAALLIAFGQLKNILGISYSSTPSFVSEAVSFVQHAPEAQPRALVLAAVTLAVILVCQQISRWLPGPLLAIAAAAAAARVLSWHEGPDAVRFLDAVPRTAPPFCWPLPSVSLAHDLFMPALALAILGMVEAISMGKTLSARAGISFQANRELAAKGVGNIIGSFFSCMPSSASWTRSVVNLEFGARTRWNGVISAVTVLVIMLAFAPWARTIPLASLGAIVIWIACKMVDLTALTAVSRWSRTDALVMALTFASMLLIDVQYAVYLGVFVSLVLFIRHAGRLHLSEFVELAPGRYGEIEPDAETGRAPVTLLQLEGMCFFGVADELTTQLSQTAARGARVIVLRLRRAHAMDATAAEALAAFAVKFRAQGGTLMLCGIRPELHERLHGSHLEEVVGRDNMLAAGATPWDVFRQVIQQARTLAVAQEPRPSGPLIRRAAEDSAASVLQFDI
jgi:SulP family sulfate permease